MFIVYILIAISLFIFGFSLQIKTHNNKNKTNCINQFEKYRIEQNIDNNPENMNNFLEVYNIGFKDGYKTGSKIELWKIISNLAMLISIIIILCLIK